MVGLEWYPCCRLKLAPKFLRYLHYVLSILQTLEEENFIHLHLPSALS